MNKRLSRSLKIFLCILLSFLTLTILLFLYVMICFQTTLGLCANCAKAGTQKDMILFSSNPNDDDSKFFIRETYTDTGVSKFLKIKCDKCKMSCYDDKYRGLFGDVRLLGSGRSYHKWLIWGGPKDTENLFSFFKEYEKTHPELREMMLKCLKDPSVKEVEDYKTKIYDAWDKYKQEHEKDFPASAD